MLIPLSVRKNPYDMSVGMPELVQAEMDYRYGTPRATQSISRRGSSDTASPLVIVGVIGAIFLAHKYLKKAEGTGSGAVSAGSRPTE